MKLYLAINPSDYKRFSRLIPEKLKKAYILGSYYYFDNTKNIDYSNDFKDFLLDSGAFTFFSKYKDMNKKQIWEYVERYAEFIKKHDIQKYFELDIDVIIGYEEVKKIRNYLEEYTGKKAIPVWHISRGKEDFIEMCKNYDYAAIGGIASKESIVKYKQQFKQINLLAMKYDCKLHGLGFTPLKNVKRYGFYSSDSTSWKMSGVFGRIVEFQQNKLVTKYNQKKEERIIGRNVIHDHNFNEWLKYQQYLDVKAKEL